MGKGIDVSCPQCQAKFKRAAKEVSLGNTLLCPKCEHQFPVDEHILQGAVLGAEAKTFGPQ